MAFYKPGIAEIVSKPVIYYPDETITATIPGPKREALISEIEKIFANNSFLKGAETDYFIAFLWSEKKDVMTDLWTFSKLESWGSGPLADVKVLRNGRPEVGTGVASGNTLIVLGLEEQHRRKAASLAKYLRGPRPTLPRHLVK